MTRSRGHQIAKPELKAAVKQVATQRDDARGVENCSSFPSKTPVNFNMENTSNVLLLLLCIIIRLNKIN